MDIRMALVDDEAKDLAGIRDMAVRYCDERNIRCAPDCFTNAAELTNGAERYDLIFLDIDMPGISGMEAAFRIRQAERTAADSSGETLQDTQIVFVTNMAQYAVDGYRVHALDFLVKPVEYYSFCLVMDRACRRIRQENGRRVLIRVPTGVETVAAGDILWVEVTSHYLTIHTRRGDIRTKGSLADAWHMLGREAVSFFGVNRYAIVGLRHIDAVRHNCVIIEGREFPISRKLKRAFTGALAAHLGGVYEQSQ